MKKRLKAILFAVILLITTVGTWILPAIQVAAVDKISVTIHYRKFDGNYSNWNLWIWAQGSDGRQYDFTGEDEYGKICTFEMENMESVSEIGFIVRLGEWEQKDGDKDRFIEIDDSNADSIEIFLLEGDETIYIAPGEVDMTPKIKEATFPTSKKIDFKVTVALDATNQTDTSLFSVVDQDGVEYDITKVWSANPGMITEGTLIMDKKLDLGNTYKLIVEGYGEEQISVGDAFSETEFEEAYYYQGDDLGATYTPEETSFRVWAPTASEVSINLFEAGDGDNLIETISMEQDVNGTWLQKVSRDLNGIYYTYSVTVGGKSNEAVDPYAKAAGVNGNRGMVIDLASTNPEGWEADKKPELRSVADSILYELHVRDLGADTSSGISNPGTFLSLIETGTTNSSGLPTGLDHLKDLGITHVHLLPAFDYASVDETKLETAQFNWGYDPKNYNVPEGSYSTDPNNGEIRVNEFKQMVQGLHENDIRVVMDVVYNHTAATADSNFNLIVPDYYYRKDGSDFSNGSGCGNETASERAMVRKYIVDSVVYWASEYHVDGFRFDLMGLHDLETMRAVRIALDEIDPSIIIYGEGWTGGESTLLEGNSAKKTNANLLTGVSVFSDDLRDGIKGHVFTDTAQGFVSGMEEQEEVIKFGVIGATENDNVNYLKSWANAPTQSINYASAHDNLTLWDKLATSNPTDSIEDRMKMNKLSAAIVFTSQGIPFFQAGEEILRSKPSEDGEFDENSYKSSDVVNSIKWDEKTDYIDIYNYYKGLIAFRKEHDLLRMETTLEVQNNLTFMEDLPENVVGYTLNNVSDHKSETIIVIYNANKESIAVDIPKGDWSVYVDGEKAGTEVLTTISEKVANVEPISAIVLVKGETNSKNIIVIAICMIGASIIGAAAYLLKKKNSRNK